jgi:hypothetical protein
MPITGQQILGHFTTDTSNSWPDSLESLKNANAQKKQR